MVQLGSTKLLFKYERFLWDSGVLRTRKSFPMNTGNFQLQTKAKRLGCVFYCYSHFSDLPAVKKGIQR